MELTGQQKRIVGMPAGDILVSAAAGSGKTSVMTQRIVSRIRNRELDIGSVLVMTFTDAAARSMREKIEKQLRELLFAETDPAERGYLSGQLQRLGTCNISTIHAFCLEVIRNFYYEIRDDAGGTVVEPGFRIEDAGEADVLLSEAVDGLFEARYEACDRDPDDPENMLFLQLAETYGTLRSDTPVRELIKSLYGFLRSMPDYGKWMEDRMENLRKTAEDFNGSACRKEIFQALRLRAANALEGLGDFRAILASGPVIFRDPKRNAEAVTSLRQFADFIGDLAKAAALPGTDWDTVYRMFASMPDPSSLNGRTSSEDKKELRHIFDRHFAELVFFGTGMFGTKAHNSHFLYKTDFVFTSDAAGIERDIAFMGPLAGELFRLAGETDRRYAALKRESNMIDFSDFEHMALRILREGNAGGYYREKFKEIYIDEYQDTSGIQEAVISAVARGNVFMEGDIKQSIYRFRHARPEIFLGKLLTFSDGADAGGAGGADGAVRAPGGCLAELNRNFRSVRGILEAVNDVFYQIMSADSGEVDYSAEHALVPFREPGEGCALRVQLLMTDTDAAESAGGPADPSGPADAADAPDGGDDAGTGSGETEDGESGVQEDGSGDALTAEDLKACEKEAVTVAAEIAALIASGTAPGDVAVLARTKSQCAVFADALEKSGIDVLREAGGSDPDYYELEVAEQFLQVLDNPCQDIPLAGLMRSPFFGTGFSEEELLEIRISGGEGSAYFHECCGRYRREGEREALRRKLEGFFDKIESCRAMADHRTPGEILEKMYGDSGLFAYASVMPEGDRRIRYLNAFRDWAHHYASSRHCGLYGTMRRLGALRERADPEPLFPVEESRADRVRVMTIHKSKGLEYGTVFIAGLSRKLSPGRQSGPVLLTADRDPGLWFIDPERQCKYPTPLVHAASESIIKSELAEEMRLLYVAMTRARDRLVLSGTYSASAFREGRGFSETADKASRHAPDAPLPFHLVLSAGSAADWIFMALARNPHVDLRILGAEAEETPQDAASAAKEKAGSGEEDCRFYSDCWEIRPVRAGKTAAGLPGRTDVLPHPSETEDAETEGTGEDAARTGRESSLPEEWKDAEYEDVLRVKFFGRYAYENAAGKPLKFSAGEIEQPDLPGREDPDAEPGIPVDLPAAAVPARSINMVLRKAQGAEDAGMSAAERGTAVHSFLRLADIEKPAGDLTAEGVRDHLQEMLRSGMIGQKESDAIMQYARPLAAFFAGPLAARMRAASARGPGSLFREIPFTLRIGCREFYGEDEGFSEDDAVHVQGIIDCWFIEEDGAVLVDYKTDAITGSRAEIAGELQRRYGTQLSVYARAIREIAGIPVKQAVIWLAGAGESYEIRCAEKIRIPDAGQWEGS